jgi:hypothetical protein
MVEKSPEGVKGAERLKSYWVRGEGALKIRWNTEGDFKRCVAELGKYVRDPEGLCNTYHQAATGGPPGHGSAEVRKQGHH